MQKKKEEDERNVMVSTGGRQVRKEVYLKGGSFILMVTNSFERK